MNIVEFKYRFLDGKVVLFNKINTAFTYMNQETELFKVVNIELKGTMEEYFIGPLGNNVFQFSPMPWVSYTHVSHTNAGKKDNATPIFVWGKFFERDGRMLLPFSVQVHHSFVDGIHIGRLSDSLQNKLNEY